MINQIAFPPVFDGLPHCPLNTSTMKDSNKLTRDIPFLANGIKELIWIDNPEKKASDIFKVMANAKVPMPHIVGDGHIEITEQTYPYRYYEATLWCFNRGTTIAEGNSVIECKANAIKWWTEFVSGFLDFTQEI